MKKITQSPLPDDAGSALLVGRAWQPGIGGGPTLVGVLEGRLVDLSAAAATMSELLDLPEPAAAVRAAMAAGRVLGSVAEAAAHVADLQHLHLLAPCDLQPVKAAGVTFAASMLERVIEEQARGEAERADEIRQRMGDAVGRDLSRVKPGSPEAAALKEFLVANGMWSQYLEVGIGPDAEVFTKAPPLSAVGAGSEVGLHPGSRWNNPEPEIVLAVNSRGHIVGAALGNDVNLRDFEGRSALLLGKAKDNNGSCAIGPFIRLFDEGFSLDDVRSAELVMEVRGEDGFVLQGASSMAKISRDPLELVAQTIGAHHQYPDGLMLFCGTMFAPVEDRGEPGAGFTHKLGDVVRIRSARLGCLENRVNLSTQMAPWTFGLGALMHNLAARGLLGR